MRFRFLFLLALAGFATACSTEAPPVRLDFVGSANLTSSDRTVTSADTVLTRVYASSESEETLARLRITVHHEPTALPIVYPSPITGYDPKDAPKDLPRVFLDSVLGLGVKSILLQNRLSARSTSGTERWEYTVTDGKGRTATRAYRLTVRKGDSAAVFHSYSILARPTQTGTQGRRFLALRPGLLLPKHAVNSEPDNQQLVDLVFVARQNDYSLESLSSPDLSLSAARWPAANRRITLIRRTSLNRDAFQALDTSAELQAAFDNGTAPASPHSTGALAKENVLAFQVPINGTESRYGVMLISELVRVPVPLITCAVRIQK